MTEIEQLGRKTKVESSEEGKREEKEHKNSRIDVIRLCLMATVAAISLTALGKGFAVVDIVAVIAIFLGGYPVYKETFESLRHGRVNMEVSMAVAIFASLAVGQYGVSALITFFVLLSEYIERYAVDRGRQTIVLLEKSVPKKALVRRNDSEVEVNIRSIGPNDIVVVRDGERIPVDGTIVVGSALVNQSAITGESDRFEKKAGDSVYAGSINESGLVEIRTEKVGSETLFGKIIKLVEEAENRKAPIQRTSDRLAAWLVEFAIGFAAITFVLTQNPISALSVVVVPVPAALRPELPLPWLR